MEVFGIPSPPPPPRKNACVSQGRLRVSAGKSTRGASDFRPCSIEGSKNKGPDRAHNPGISFFKRAETMKLFRALFPGMPGNKTGRLLCHRQERIDFRGFSNERGNKLLLVIARGVSGYGWDVEFWEVDIRGGFRLGVYACSSLTVTLSLIPFSLWMNSVVERAFSESCCRLWDSSVCVGKNGKGEKTGNISYFMVKI